MIAFNIPFVHSETTPHLHNSLASQKFSGDGPYNLKCQELLNTITQSQNFLMGSCTHALELAGMLEGLSAYDEVIMPSFTFVSTANAIATRGAIPVFVDIRPDTLNIDEKLIEAAITPRTKLILVVHYAGVACDMETICRVAKKYHIPVLEDAAQGIGAYYKGKHLGTIGELGAFSFHETKNIHCGEGGAICINDHRYLELTEIMREKGTNRINFQRGEVNKYTWVNLGSSYLLGELSAAFLFPQLMHLKDIISQRLLLWEKYYHNLKNLELSEFLELPTIPRECQHNAHIFYIKLKNPSLRPKLIEFLKSQQINAVFHYIPLHSSPMGLKIGRLAGEDRFTTSESLKILRLPLHNYLKPENIDFISNAIASFFKNH
jgi:dTDP-4-amino-4,6-dideoxygalactose transaminase